MNSILRQGEKVQLRVNRGACFLLCKALIVFLSISAFSVRATPVEIYSSPVAVGGDGSTQIETIGILKYAYCGYNSGGQGNLAVIGKEGKSVTFVTSFLNHLASTSGLGTNIGFSPNAARAERINDYEPVTGLTGNYRLALRDLYFVNTSPFTCAVTLKNLTAGRTYLVQIWASDGYGTTERQVKYELSDGTDSRFFQIDLNDVNQNKGKGQVGSFKAVAESTSLVLTMNAAIGNFAGFSAIQVRDITPMYWTVASGNWNTTGLNWDPAGDTEVVWSSATGSVVNAYFTNNATATLISDVWARDVNVLSNTTIQRASSGTTTLTVMRNLQVDANRTLTVGNGSVDQATVLVISNAVTGAGTVSIKNDSRIVLGKNAIGSANAAIVGDGQDYRGAIQSIDNGDAEWSGQITTTYIDAWTRLGAGFNSVLTISGKISGNTLAIRSENVGSPIGIVVLSNPNNDYTGGTTLYTPLRLGCNNAVPVSSGWLFSSGVNNPSLDLNGYNQEIRSITGTMAGANITNSSATASLLTFNTLTDQSATSLLLIGNFSVLKKGVAKHTLGATCTYTGTTTIEAGTLALTATGEINATAKLILAGGTFDVSAKTGYIFGRPLQVMTNSSVTGSLTLGATTELTFDGTAAALTGGTIAMAGQTLKLTTTTTLAVGTDYPLISGYTGTFPILDISSLTVPDGATASLVWSGGLLSLSVVEATTDTTTTLAIDPAATGVYGTNIVLTVTVTPAEEVPDGTTVNLYAAADLSTVLDSAILLGGEVQFTVVKPAVGTYSYVAKYMGGGVYRPSQSEASPTVSIQKKTLMISEIESDKLFDGTTNVTPRFVTTGVVSGEPNPVTCSGYYQDAAVGTSKAVMLIWGLNSLNYELSGDDPSDVGTIYAHALWTGGASDGLWHTPGNWDTGIVPNNTGVSAIFNTDTIVALSSGVSIKTLTFNADVTLNGPGKFTVGAQYATGEVLVASSKTATFNAGVDVAVEGIQKKGLGRMVLMGNQGFSGQLSAQEGISEINQTTEGPLTARDYAIAENATLRFVCAPLGSAGTQLTGTKSVTGDGIFEVASGYLRVQSSAEKVSVAMSDKGEIIVRDGAFMNNFGAGGDRFINNRAKLLVEGTGLFGLTDDTVKVGSLRGDGQVKAETVSHTLSIMGSSDGTFSGVLAEKDTNNKLMLAKWGTGTQILSGTNRYTGYTGVYGGCLRLAGGDNRLSPNTPVTVTNAVLDLGLTQQTFNVNPVFRSGSKLAVSVSKTAIGSLTLTNSVDVSAWKLTINNPDDYPRGAKFAVISTDKTLTGVPTLVDMPSGFIINKSEDDKTIYVDFPAMVIFFK